MARFILILYVLLASLVSNFAAAPDIPLARKLIDEARGLCGVSCELLAEFGAAQAKTGDLKASKKSFADAWETAAKLKDGVERRFVLDEIAMLQAQAGQIKEATEAAQRLPSRYEQAMALGTIAFAQIETGKTKAALQTVGLIPTEEIWQRNSTLQLIVMSLSSRRDFTGAIRVLNLIPGDIEEAAKILARNIPVEERNPREQTIVRRAMMKSTGLITIAQDQAEAGDFKDALQTARSIGLDRHRDMGLMRVARVAADSGDLTVAQAAFKGIRSREQKELALVRVVAAMARLERLKKASALAETIKDPNEKAEAFFEMAAAQAAQGDTKTTRSLYENALLLNPSDNDVQNAAAKKIVSAYLQSPHLELAEAFTHEIKDPRTLSEAFQAIANTKWQNKKISDAQRLFDKSRQAAQKIMEPYQKCARLREVATAQFEAGDRERAKATIALAVIAAREIEIGGGTDVIALTETATTQRTIGDRDGAIASGCPESVLVRN
ncbi:hypothetical protein [uncultured Gimesia sp.]|uniref:hypothetical protein n=1 Tax=uncultured Gimesia sp. TaxID=1678688 RepID=UPI00262ED4F6|nr:hypothetical protein [uncultured Gimesia sp.]